MPAEKLARSCAVPGCTNQTLRTYCIRCEVNGQAAEHAAASNQEEAGDAR